MMASFEKACSTLVRQAGLRHVIRRCLHVPRMLKETIAPKEPKNLKWSPDANVPRIVDKGIAQDIARALKPRLNEKPAFECYPGVGLLSKALLDIGVRNLVLCEPQQKYWSQLEDFENRYEQVKLEKGSFFRKKWRAKCDADYMEPVQHIWSEGVQMQVVGSGHPKDMCLWMFDNACAMANGSFPHHRGRANLLILVSGYEHQLMENGYKVQGEMWGPVPSRVHDYQLYYTITTLLKIPKYAFNGEVDHKGRIPKTATWDQDNYYLVEITPRPDLFTAICEKDMFSSFITFNNQLYRPRKSNLIHRLERWYPGLGLVAIDMGYTMLDTVKNLKPQHVPTLFKEFRACGGLVMLHDNVQMEETMTTVALEKGTPVIMPEHTVGLESRTSAFEALTLTSEDKLVKKNKAGTEKDPQKYTRTRKRQSSVK